MIRLPRLMEPLVETLLGSARVVVLEGGRATGKSTLCDHLIERHQWAPRIDLSDQNTLDVLRLDPVRFLGAQSTPCVIDEAQLEPELTGWVKRIVDQRAQPGQFLLTGSARLGRHSLGGSDPLAGRAIRLRLSSMTQGELDQRAGDFVRLAFGAGWNPGPVPSVSERDPWLGGLPSVSGVIDGRWSANWEREIASYVESVIPLGVSGSRADLGRLLRTFRYLAANSGQLLNLARAANELGLQVSTVRGQLDALESCFLIQRVEAHRPVEHRVVTAHPRIFAADPGLATWAARAWSSEPDGSAGSRHHSAALIGSLAESVVAHDILAQCDADPQRIVVRHWRDGRNQREVDLLLVHPDGGLVAIEVKASSSVGPGDANGLRALSGEAGGAVRRCIVVYEGSSVIELTVASDSAPIVGVPRAMI